MLVDGHTQLLSQALADPQKAKLFSDEGPFTNAARYTVQELSTAALDENTSGFHGFKSSPFWDEQVSSFLLAPGVRVHLNAPNEVALRKNPLLLVLYALPNGNSIEQTIGKHTSGSNDWHFEIQHIAAQTRFLRKQLPARSIVVAYLEAEGKSWPLWRKQHNDQTINQIVSTIRSIFPAEKTEIVLSGHSGGGSFTFGYLNSVESIPNEITRLAFLDSNYAYDREQHLEKISRWLKAKNNHSLCVLAYDDANALLNGKSFVSAAGGTWGKSHEMQKDLAATFEFSLQETPELEHYTALNGRVQFILRKNPDRKILHTVQVERNGFIHAMLSGTPLESVGYNYFGERAYTNYIRP